MTGNTQISYKCALMAHLWKHWMDYQLTIDLGEFLKWCFRLFLLALGHLIVRKEEDHKEPTYRPPSPLCPHPRHCMASVWFLSVCPLTSFLCSAAASWNLSADKCRWGLGCGDSPSRDSISTVSTAPLPCVSLLLEREIRHELTFSRGWVMQGQVFHEDRCICS